MKIFSILIVIIFVGCISYPVKNFDSIQEYELPKYYGNYYAENNSLLGFSAFLNISAGSVKAEVYREVKGACFLIFDESLEPVLKEYSFGERIQYYKGPNSILYKSNGKLYLEFIEDGKESYEFIGKTTIEFTDRDKKYSIKLQEINDCVKKTAEWFHKNDFFISDWKINNIYYPYKNEIIQTKDSLMVHYDFERKIKILSNDDLLKLIDKINDETLKIIRQRHQL